jgi:hypothetical protein
MQSQPHETLSTHPLKPTQGANDQIKMPSPAGTNNANLFVPDRFYDNPLAAYDNKHGLQDDNRVARLRAKLGQDGVATLKKLALAFLSL